MKNKITYIKWIVLPLAFFAWAAVGLFAWTISSDEADRATHVQVVEDAESKGAAAARLHSVVLDTAIERAQLDSTLRIDIVSVVEMIEAAGRAAGVNISVSNAQPESVPPSQAVAGVPIMATGFVVEGSGTFSALMRAIQLFETLPVPSTLGRLDIQYTTAASPGSPDSWHLNASIRVLTTSDIRS